MKIPETYLPARTFWRWYEGVLLLLFGVLAAAQLFIPPYLGVADNNDFPKLMGHFCLGRDGHPLFEYAHFSFQTDPKYCWDSQLPTSALLPAAAAVGIAGVFLPPGDFDLRILGGIYAGLFILFFWLLQRSVRGLHPWARLSMPPLFLLVFNTATHVPAFSTFYFDTASFVFLLLSSVAVCRLVLRDAIPLWEYLLAAAAVVLFTTSKSQHTVLGLLMIPAFLMSFQRTRFPAKPVRIGAAVCIGAGAVMMFAVTPRWYQTTASYNALFYQCLPRSSDPAGDLAALGLDPGMIQYVGKHAFLPDAPLQTQQQVEDLTPKLSAGRMIRYFVTHPRVAMLVLESALGEGGHQRVRMVIGDRLYRLGNYEQSAGKAPESQSGFLDIWSTAKAFVFGGRGWLYGLYTLGLLAAAWHVGWHQPARYRLRMCVLAGMITLMVAASAGVTLFDGVDTGRHLSLFNTLLDLCLCGTIGCFLHTEAAKPR